MYHLLCHIIQAVRHEVLHHIFLKLLTLSADIAFQHIIIVGSDIRYVVLCVIVRQIFICRIAVKCKFQHLHARITGFLHQLLNLWHDHAEILSYNLG